MTVSPCMAGSEHHFNTYTVVCRVHPDTYLPHLLFLLMHDTLTPCEEDWWLENLEKERRVGAAGGNGAKKAPAREGQRKRPRRGEASGSACAAPPPVNSAPDEIEEDFKRRREELVGRGN